jgi:hypothetical protein
VVEAARPAVTFVYSSNMAPMMLDLPNTSTRVVDLVDVYSEKWRVFAETTRGPMRFNYRCDWRSKRISDGAAEAKLIALACLEPPKGRSRWTLKRIEGALLHYAARRRSGEAISTAFVESAVDVVGGRVNKK